MNPNRQMARFPWPHPVWAIDVLQCTAVLIDPVARERRFKGQLGLQPGHATAGSFTETPQIGGRLSLPNGTFPTHCQCALELIINLVRFIKWQSQRNIDNFQRLHLATGRHGIRQSVGSA